MIAKQTGICRASVLHLLRWNVGFNTISKNLQCNNDT